MWTYGIVNTGKRGKKISTPGEQDGRRFACTTADAKDRPGKNSRPGLRQYDVPHNLPFCRTQRNADSLRLTGTLFNASSVETIMTGKTNNASVEAAQSMAG